MVFRWHPPPVADTTNPTGRLVSCRKYATEAVFHMKEKGVHLGGSSFDRIARRLAATTNRRRGVAALVAGALGIAGIAAAQAVVPIPPNCLATNALCTDGAQCCSGRCIAKRLKDGGGYRCAQKTSNRKQKDACTKKGKECQRDADCCKDLTCQLMVTEQTKVVQEQYACLPLRA